MDNATKRFLIEAHLEKAHDDLITANDMLADDHFRGAINRAYYTVFHAASAALLWLDIELAKHSGVQSAFGEFLIKSGIIEPEFGKIFIESIKPERSRITIYWLCQLALLIQDKLFKTRTVLSSELRAT